ncbi:hypothetical protein G3I40_41370 [Streptomyces sp. SID14478]|uniref:hypothetical protein n=1 Tax=Streptomyces sp. SID14478 TaxID=2706073 RepID=UPI0013DF05ED|nr:hypothetical protein [Streptomyces sp. SID14478]NEB81618.1 hypothetical protein [Streptomyces sp. SID14478]
MTTETAVQSADRSAQEPAATGGGESGRLPLPAPALAALVAVVVALGAWADQWYLPLVAGLAAGVYGAWHRRGFLRATGLLVLLGPVPWGVLLLVRELAGDTIGGTARTTAGLAGLPASAAVTIVLTLIVALLQAAAGNWFGRALFRTFARGAKRS